jgi:hypothetical protein
MQPSRHPRDLGIMVVPVEVDWRVLEMLAGVGCMSETVASSEDATAIGQAIAEWFARSARI